MSLFAAFRTPKDEKLYYPSDESIQSRPVQTPRETPLQNGPDSRKRLSGIFDKLKIGLLQIQANEAIQDKSKAWQSINLEALQTLIAKDFPIIFSQHNTENFASLKKKPAPLWKTLDTSLQKTLEALNGIPSDAIKKSFQSKLTSLFSSISTQELNISLYFLKFYLKNAQEAKQPASKARDIQKSKLNLQKDIYKIISSELSQRALQNPQCSSFANNEFKIEDLTTFPGFREHLLVFIGTQTRAPQEKIFIDHVLRFKEMFNDPKIIYDQVVEQERMHAAQKILEIISEININDFEIHSITNLLMTSTTIPHTLFDKTFESVVVSIFQNYVCASAQESFWKSPEGHLFCIQENIPIFKPKSINLVSQAGQKALCLPSNALEK